MLCEDCQQLVQDADHAWTSWSHDGVDVDSTVLKREVSTQEFQLSLHRKCYFCTRLLVVLGDDKWHRILYELPKTNVIVFDKSAEWDHIGQLILVRLGCRLTPILQTDAEEQPVVVGKGSSFGYLQLSLLSGITYSFDSQDDVATTAVGAGTATSTGDPRVLNLVASWLEICKQSKAHVKCSGRSDQPAYCPKRLIDVFPDDTNGDNWRLTEFGPGAVSPPYLTLSHRWGPGIIKLNHATHSDMVRGIPVSSLPGTYQDAIKVARHLKVRYLWIDSICIFQDERLDIQKEASRMADVFGNAICNISALLGRSDGLFSSRHPQTTSSDNITLRRGDCGFDRDYVINDLDLWRAELVHTPLSKRSWVLQEEVLAKRTVYFGARQVLWDCSQSRACETYPLLPGSMSPSMQEKVSLENPESFSAKSRLLKDNELEPINSAIWVARMFPNGAKESIWSYQEDLLEMWPRFIAHYSMRQLTFPTDKLLAIAGVARLLSGAMQDRFVAGLWESNLLEGLLWYIRANTTIERPLDYRAPSWSWASCEGYVLHAEPFSRSWTVARALRAICQTATGDEFGMVTSAELTLQAYCLRLQMSEDGCWTGLDCNHSFPRTTVRLDTSEDIAGLREFYAAIIRTTAYRLTDNMEPLDLPNDSSWSATKGKILLAAQGILLTPSSTTATIPSESLSFLVENAHERLQKTQYRRIGYFALEDRKSGSLTPKWVTPGLNIFHPPPAVHNREERGLQPFSFEEQQEFMTILHVV
ncbi:hypothetical protein H2200_013429 [Cladophialophora chaetospira]|uniref:Heterokaryon incompatibility domain-containing protein n=1 Tax=Cladophialophora chaetospira TaxID=386627 RepID=A0AA38TZ45_9EURO|nr:hypothetical protein H2200_013429 [Cladophialophora chaetospira]